MEEGIQSDLNSVQKEEIHIRKESPDVKSEHFVEQLLSSSCVNSVIKEELICEEEDYGGTQVEFHPSSANVENSATPILQGVENSPINDQCASLEMNVAINEVGTQTDICYARKESKLQKSDPSPSNSGSLQKYICNMCDKSFADSYFLSKHKLFHNVVKSYQCDECGRAFIIKQHLLQHKKKCRSFRFQCNECKNVFAQKSHLLAHKLIHEGVKSYECDKIKIIW